MTTNQTIDGVPRELLERCARELSTGTGPAPKNRAQELRALLDASANSALKGLEAWQSGRDGMRQERDEALGKVETLKSDNAKLADDRTRLSTELEILRPAYRSVLAQLDAAQPQGEPVAVFEIDHTGYRCKVILDPLKQFPPNGTKLYADQPAPVAVERVVGSYQTCGIMPNPHFEYADKQRALKPRNDK